MSITSSEYTLTHDIEVDLPSHCCCNCGSNKHVRLIDTRLKESRFTPLSGTQLYFNWPLPYCQHCQRSASRASPGFGKKLLLSTLLFCLMVTIAMAFSFVGLLTPFWLALLAAASTAVIFARYRLRKPPAPQTSYYQPVQLLSIKQNIHGEITGFVLHFSNKKYQRLFCTVNNQSVLLKLVEIR